MYLAKPHCILAHKVSINNLNKARFNCMVIQSQNRFKLVSEGILAKQYSTSSSAGIHAEQAMLSSALRYHCED